MSSRIARVVIILTLLATAIFLVALTIPVFGAGVAHALYQQSVANITPTISTDNQTTQETEEKIEQSGKQAELSNTISSNSNEKLYPGVAEKISTLKPTDDIRLIVVLEMPSDMINKINEATARGAPIDKEIEEISAEIRTRAKAAIETLPDTSVISGIQNRYSLWVQTKVGNIEALTEMPEIVGIYIGPQMCSHLPIMLLSPNNASLGCPVDQPSFSWSPYKETTKFKFVLAKDAAMTQVVKEAEVTDTSYDYDGELDYGTSYFWRVMALEPAPDDWSATFSFQTEAASVQPETPAQYNYWSTILLVFASIALAAGAGLVTWFVLIRQQRIKRKS